MTADSHLRLDVLHRLVEAGAELYSVTFEFDGAVLVILAGGTRPDGARELLMRLGATEMTQGEPYGSLGLFPCVNISGALPSGITLRIVARGGPA